LEWDSPFSISPWPNSSRSTQERPLEWRRLKHRSRNRHRSRGRLDDLGKSPSTWRFAFALTFFEHRFGLRCHKPRCFSAHRNLYELVGRQSVLFVLPWNLDIGIVEFHLTLGEPHVAQLRGLHILKPLFDWRGWGLTGTTKRHCSPEKLYDCQQRFQAQAFARKEEELTRLGARPRSAPRKVIGSSTLTSSPPRCRRWLLRSSREAFGCQQQRDPKLRQLLRWHKGNGGEAEEGLVCVSLCRGTIQSALGDPANGARRLHIAAQLCDVGPSDCCAKMR